MLSSASIDTLQASCYSGPVELDGRAFIAIVGMTVFGQEVAHLVDGNGSVWMILDTKIIKKVASQFTYGQMH